jgi:hypothetical protein
MSNAAQHVLGVPGKAWDQESDGAEKVLKKIKEASNRNFLMFSSTHGDGRNISGLVGGHAYEIVKRFEIEWKGNSKYLIFMMRNPWGKVNYAGEWKKDGSRFDDEGLRKKLDFPDLHKDEGLFYMSWDEWNAAFQSTNLIVEANSKKYCHSGHTMVDFANESSG